MEKYKTMENLEDLVFKELDKIAHKSELNLTDLKGVTDALCVLEKIRKIQNESEIEEAEYSERDPYHRGSYARSYNTRFSNCMNGYSRHSIHDRIVDKLEQMMNETSGDYEKSVIAEWITKIENN